MQTAQYKNPEFWRRKPIRWEFNNAAEDFFDFLRNDDRE